MADESTAVAQIAADFPDMPEADQARAVEIVNTVAALRKLCNADTFPQKMQRVNFVAQLDQLRQSMISALAQK